MVNDAKQLDDSDIEQKNEDAVNRLKDAIKDAVFCKEGSKKRCPRIVFVWGAGASATSGIPGGTYIRNRMLSDLEQVMETVVARNALGTDYERTKLELLKNHDPSLEYVLAIYAKVYTEQGLHEWLTQFIPSKQTSPPYFPSFAHELTAHLVKMGVLKYFITPNFDEILESALDVELENYKVVASLSEFARLQRKRIEEWDTEYGVFKPKCFVFKPHGTISRGFTLRHLPTGVQAFEKEKLSVLTEVLKDALVVFLGFGNYNEDFWLLFGETFSRGLNDDIIIVNTRPEKVKKRLHEAQHKRQTFTYKGEIERFFEHLFNLLSNDTEFPFHTGMPSRHYIRSLFFNIFSRQLRARDDEEYYRTLHRLIEVIPESWFDLRIYELELLIYLLKSRGRFIQTEATGTYRILNAFKRCEKHNEKKKREGKIEDDLRPYQVLSKVLNHGNKRLIRHSYITDVLGIPLLNAEMCFLQFNNPDFEVSDCDKLFEAVFCEIAETYCRYLRTKIGEKSPELVKYVMTDELAHNLRSELCSHFNHLWTRDESDIIPPYPSLLLRFKSPTPLKSKLELKDCTKKLLETKWDKLRTNTIAAEWFEPELLNEYSSHRTVDIMLDIDALMAKEVIQDLVDRCAEARETKAELIPSRQVLHFVHLASKITALLKKIKDYETIELNFYAFRHLDHHMSIATQGEKPITPHGAIYIFRPDKRSVISPIYLTDKNDVCSLIKYFDKAVSCSLDEPTIEKPCGHLFSAYSQRGKLTIKTRYPTNEIVAPLIQTIKDIAQRPSSKNPTKVRIVHTK